MFIEQGAEMADFEWFGSGADDRRECRFRRRMGQDGVHDAFTMKNQVGLFSQNGRTEHFQRSIGYDPIALSGQRAT
jgi:hypothetical protein